MKNDIKKYLPIAERILWALVLAVVSLPVGYLFMIFTQSKIMNESDFYIGIIGGLVMLIGLGGTSIFVAHRAKKLEAKNPVRVGLIFYSIFLVLFLLISYYGISSKRATERRDFFIEKMFSSHTNDSSEYVQNQY